MTFSVDSAFLEWVKCFTWKALKIVNAVENSEVEFLRIIIIRMVDKHRKAATEFL